MFLPVTTGVGHGVRRCSHYHFFSTLYDKWVKSKEAFSPFSRLATATRSLRSEAALDTLRRAAVHGAPPPSGAGNEEVGEGRKGEVSEHTSSVSDDGDGTEGYSLVLYNYPSFTGVMAALFAHLFHVARRLPVVILPFSSIEPFRVEDLKLRGLETCYLLDFIGPDHFAVDLSRFVPNVVAFDHRKSTLARVSQFACLPASLSLHIDTEKSSACAAYDYFSKKFSGRSPMIGALKGETIELANHEDQLLPNHEDKQRVENILKYIEDADLRKWVLLDTAAFNIGLKEERVELNCLTNPYVFEQLLDIDPNDLISKGNLHLSSRQDAAKKLLGKEFKIRLGRGFYGECLCIRADGHSNLSHEIGDELSERSAAAGLRPIGAVVFMQRGNLKMCLRTTDNSTNTSEVAKAYGGGGKPSSSSFMIRMDEYNHWTFANTS